MAYWLFSQPSYEVFLQFVSSKETLRLFAEYVWVVRKCRKGLANPVHSVIVNYNTNSPRLWMGAPGGTGRSKMSKLSPYVNEIVSFIVMALLLVALVSGQLNAQAYKMASLDAAHDEAFNVSHFRLEDE